MTPVKHGDIILPGKVARTRVQDTALAYPCRTTEESAHDRYWSNEVRLTFDLYGAKEMFQAPCWHAMVRNVPMNNTRARRDILKALGDIGTGKTTITTSGSDLHARRASSLSEQAEATRAREGRNGGDKG